MLNPSRPQLTPNWQIRGLLIDISTTCIKNTFRNLRFTESGENIKRHISTFKSYFWAYTKVSKNFRSKVQARTIVWSANHDFKFFSPNDRHFQFTEFFSNCWRHTYTSIPYFTSISMFLWPNAKYLVRTNSSKIFYRFDTCPFPNLTQTFKDIQPQRLERAFICTGMDITLATLAMASVIFDWRVWILSYSPAWRE